GSDPNSAEIVEIGAARAEDSIISRQCGEKPLGAVSRVPRIVSRIIDRLDSQLTRALDVTPIEWRATRRKYDVGAFGQAGAQDSGAESFKPSRLFVTQAPVNRPHNPVAGVRLTRVDDAPVEAKLGCGRSEVRSHMPWLLDAYY